MTTEPGMDPSASPLPRARSSRRVLALALFLVVTLVNGFSVLTRSQLEALGGMTDEWYELGVNLAQNGVLGIAQDPIVLRPPGYPAWIAVLLRAGARPDVLRHDPSAGFQLVYAAQGLTLAASSTLLFLWLAHSLRTSTAVGAALWFGTNPYSVACVGMLHYDVLHWFLIIAGCLCLERATTPHARDTTWMLAGVVWGLATLTRPLTLLLPPFVLVLLVLRSSSVRRALRQTALFTLCMAIVIAPWTARNYRVVGRFAPVNVQAWPGIWGSTVRVLPARPDHYNWFELLPEMTRVLSRILGTPGYDYDRWVRNSTRIEQGFREEVLANLRRQPGVYAANVLRGLQTLTFDINASLVGAFRYVQRPGASIPQQWFEPGSNPPWLHAPITVSFRWFQRVLALLALAGAVAAARRRSTTGLVALLVGLCLMLGHAATYMDMMYYYLKVPFLAVFAAIALDELAATRWVAASSGGIWLSRVLAVSLGAWSVGLTIALLI